MMTARATEIKERPIVLRDHEVRAILEGRQTQLRRIVERPCGGLSTVAKFCLKGRAYPDLYAWVDGHPDDLETWGVVGEPMCCPFGVPGDRLYARETWAISGHYKDGPRYEYRAHPADGEHVRSVGRWRPSTCMPREASRIILEIVSVRVERLDELTPIDAGAEGIRITFGDTLGPWYGFEPGQTAGRSPVEAFAALWDSIYKKSPPWSSSPWVWVISFTRAG